MPKNPTTDVPIPDADDLDAFPALRR
jgi:hypothetical protein